VPLAPDPVDAHRRAHERVALDRLFQASILGLISLGIAVVIAVAVFATLSSSITSGGNLSSSGGSGAGSSTVNTFEAFTALSALSSVASFGLGILLFYLMGLSFAALQDPEFRTPYALTWAGVVGGILGVLGSLALVSAVSSVFSGSPDTGALIGAAGLLLVGAIVGLVGAVGMIVGIWRLGEWFGSGGLKAAAILMIFLSPVAFAIILWVSVSLRRDLVRRQGPAGLL
jgi:hypothetical protein